MDNKEKFNKPALSPELYGLPSVIIEIQPQRIKPNGTFKSENLIIKNENNEEIGTAILNIFYPPNREHYAYLNTIKIKEELRGKGYGKATYLELIKKLADVKLKSGFQLSRGSSKVWEWLCQNGLAVKTSDGKTDENKLNAGYSSAEYEAIKYIG